MDHPFPDTKVGGERRETVEELRELFARKAAAEVCAADALAPGSDTIPSRGNPLARVLVLKGLPGPAEASGGPALSGADGDAIVKALVALGYREDDAFFTLSRPVPTAPGVRLARLAALLLAVDPIVAIGLDAEAAEDLGQAAGVELKYGVAAEVTGVRYLAVDGLEASLADEARKRRVWRQLKAAAPPGPVY